jgi:hypothetical protein
MPVKITDIQRCDPLYFIRWRLIGMTGEAEQIAGNYWYSLTLKTKYRTFKFMYCQFEKTA